MRRANRKGPSRTAIGKFVEFQGFEPRYIDTFSRGFAIPLVCFDVGPAISEVYRSDKVDPETATLPRGTQDYIHHHGTGVTMYRVGVGAAALKKGHEKRTPKWIRNCESLVLIGECLEWSYRYGDDEVQAVAEEPYPELYCTPNGRALLVIDKKRHVVAMIWGGKLRVERRGIVG